jgi:hypothetical protein
VPIQLEGRSISALIINNITIFGALAEPLRSILRAVH